MPVGSSLRVSAADLDVTPKPYSIRSVRKYSQQSLSSAYEPYQRRIIHRQYNDTLMLRAVFADSSHMCFHDVSPIQKWHLSHSA